MISVNGLTKFSQNKCMCRCYGAGCLLIVISKLLIRMEPEKYNMHRTGIHQNDGSGDNQDIDKTKLIVNYIPQLTTEEDIALIFGQIGQLVDVKIMRDYRTGYSFGYGFVKYAKPEDAAKAIEILNGLFFRKKRLKVSYSRPPGQAMKDSNLYISNLPKEFTEKELEEIFGVYGEIVQRNVLKDKNSGLSRGVAFVRYSKGEEAQAAIANLDGKTFPNSCFPLSVRVAEDHSRQKAQWLENQFLLLNRGFIPIRSSRSFNQRSRLTKYSSNWFLGGGDSAFPLIW